MTFVERVVVHRADPKPETLKQFSAADGAEGRDVKTIFQWALLWSREAGVSVSKGGAAHTVVAALCLRRHDLIFQKKVDEATAEGHGGAPTAAAGSPQKDTGNAFDAGEEGGVQDQVGVPRRARSQEDGDALEDEMGLPILDSFPDEDTTGLFVRLVDLIERKLAIIPGGGECLRAILLALQGAFAGATEQQLMAACDTDPQRPTPRAGTCRSVLKSLPVQVKARRVDGQP